MCSGHHQPSLDLDSSLHRSNLSVKETLRQAVKQGQDLLVLHPLPQHSHQRLAHTPDLQLHCTLHHPWQLYQYLALAKRDN